MGYKLVIFPSTADVDLREGLRGAVSTRSAHRTTAGSRDRFMSFDDVNALLGLEWQEPR